jgi:hypothetical protein
MRFLFMGYAHRASIGSFRRVRPRTAWPVGRNLGLDGGGDRTLTVAGKGEIVSIWPVDGHA